MVATETDITPAEKRIWNLLADVHDPEVPVLTVLDLGIVRGVQARGKKAGITVTPTYSGCPATEVIEHLIREKITGAGFDVDVKTTLSPPWTTDWISEEGREKLREYGIAPPQGSTSKRSLLGGDAHIPCPQCGSKETEQVSEFGSTPCKALHRCKSCAEPFEYFKCL